MQRALGSTLGVAAIVLSLSLAPAALAGVESSGGVSMPGAESKTSQQADPICEAARAAARAPGSCLAASTLTVDPATVSAVANNPGSATNAVRAARTVWSKTWSQTSRGLYYVNWVEKHTGKIYYDGTKVWQAPRYGYNGGYHNCDQGYGIGYDVSVRTCATYGDPNTYQIDMYDSFRVSVFFHGFPIFASHSMTAHARRDGAIW